MLARLSELYQEEENKERQAFKGSGGVTGVGSRAGKVEEEGLEWDRGLVARMQQLEGGRVERGRGGGSEEAAEEERMQRRFDAITVPAPGSIPGAGLKATLKAQLGAGQALVQV
jgi:hypothetical protein